MMRVHMETAECWLGGRKNPFKTKPPLEARPCSPELSGVTSRQLCGGLMAQVCMKRGGLSQRVPALELETLAVERDWLLLLALSAPAQAHPGLPGVGGPGPGQ